MRENRLSGSMRGGARRSLASGLSIRWLRLLYSISGVTAEGAEWRGKAEATATASLCDPWSFPASVAGGLGTCRGAVLGQRGVASDSIRPHLQATNRYCPDPLLHASLLGILAGRGDGTKSVTHFQQALRGKDSSAAAMLLTLARMPRAASASGILRP